MRTCSKLKVGPLARRDLPDDIVASRRRVGRIILLLRDISTKADWTQPYQRPWYGTYTTAKLVQWETIISHTEIKQWHA